MHYLIGLDIGTSAVKAIALDPRNGVIAASAQYPLEMTVLQPGWAEQDPEDYVDAAFHVLRDLTAKLGRSHQFTIGLTGQMHTLVALDAQNQVIRPAILWCDTRTSIECEEITQRVGLEKLKTHVGNLALEGFTVPKILWLKHHEPANFQKLHTVLMPKDYVAFRLTRELTTDWSDASGTLAFNQNHRQFDKEFLDILQIDSAIFPKAVSSLTEIGVFSEEASNATGIAAGTSVVAGAADNAAAAVGLGIVRDGRAMVSVGTSGVVLAHTSQYVTDTRLRLHSFCHAVPNQYYLMGVMLSAGGALRWYRDTLCDGEKISAELRRVDPYDIILDTASTASLGSAGLYFLPYLQGERTPHNDAYARGAWIGLHQRISKAEMSRAVLEGISYGLLDSLQLVRNVCSDNALSEVKSVRLTGGGAKHPFWRQLLADMFGIPVSLTTSTEGPAFGAALLAGIQGGFFTNAEQAADALVHDTRIIEPCIHQTEKYREQYEVFKSLYTALQNSFRHLL